MDCKNTFTKNSRRTSAFTLMELMVASSIGLVVSGIAAGLIFFSTRSFAGMTNYTEMCQRSRLALDKMSKEIRQAKQFTTFTSNNIILLNPDGTSFGYTFDSGNRTLVRSSAGIKTIYLTECDTMRFSLFQHTMKSNTFDCYDPAYMTNGRVLQVAWHCTRKTLGNADTESVLSSKIALRNK